MRQKVRTAEQTPARFRPGTLARVDASLGQFEKRAAFIRTAVENELDRRKAPVVVDQLKPPRAYRAPSPASIAKSKKARKEIRAKNRRKK